MEVTPPPPLRRIVVDEAPTTVAPSPGPAGNGSGTATPTGAAATTAAQRVAAQRRPTHVVDRLHTEELSIAYNGKLAVKQVTLPVRQGEVLALIGPSGCGKTTLLRTLNRLVELTPGVTRDGRVTLDGIDVDTLDVTALRRKIGMVFQQPNPFPMSVFDNIAYGLRERGRKRPSRRELAPYVVHALERAGLYHEVADDLTRSAQSLSGGQQQRLCIARSLAVNPEVLLLDEPCSALDPISTAAIEEQIVQLRSEVAIVIVTHNLQQAQRVADRVGFMYLGDLVEYGPAEQVFGAPHAKRTRDYVSGSFG
jgi:phosphate transport system ATP-binding protein